MFVIGNTVEGRSPTIVNLRNVAKIEPAFESEPPRIAFETDDSATWFLFETQEEAELAFNMLTMTIIRTDHMINLIDVPPKNDTQSESG